MGSEVGSGEGGGGRGIVVLIARVFVIKRAMVRYLFSSSVARCCSIFLLLLRSDNKEDRLLASLLAA